MVSPRFNEGSCAHFVTTKTYRGRRVFDDSACCKIVVDNLVFYVKHYDYELIAYCIMPDHVHFIIQWDTDLHPQLSISKIVQSVKSHSARQIVDYLHHPVGRRGPLTSPVVRSGQGTRATHDGEYPHRRMSE
jgi:REP element-mobilizing transposase RayT